MQRPELEAQLLGKVIRKDVGCGNGNCPAVLRTNRGTFVIVGLRMAESEKIRLIEAGTVGIYTDEDAVEIPADLVEIIKRI